MIQRKRWTGSTRERRNKLRLGWHEGRMLVLCVVCSVTDREWEILPVAWRGVAFAFLRLRFNSEIDQQVHTYTSIIPYNSCGLATSFSTRSLYLPHHASFPLRFFISACANISPTVTHLIAELCSVMTAAVSGPACRALNFFPLNAS